MRFYHSPVRSCAGAANIEPGRASSGDEDSMLGHATPRCGGRHAGTKIIS